MIGQGSPRIKRSSNSTFARALSVALRSKFVFTLIVALAVVLVSPHRFASAQPSQASSASKPTDSKPWVVGTRISWGGATNESWVGSIKVHSGELSKVRSLAMTPDSPGGVEHKTSELAVIHERSPTNYSGADLTIRGTAATTLTVTLHPVDRPNQQFESRVQLSQIINQPYSERIDSDGNQLNIDRQPGDKIVVDVLQDRLVFKPKDFLSLRLTPNLTGINARTANCRIKIVPARQQTPVIWTNSFQFSLDEKSSGKNERFEIPVPGVEGVYDVLLELEPNWYQVPFNNKNRSVSRKIQFVVLESQSPAQQTNSKSTTEWSLFNSIDITNGRTVGRNQNGSRPNFNPFGVNKQPLGNEHRQVVNFGQQSMIQLDSGGWHAIQLPVDQIGKPHIVELDYLASPNIALGVSIVQPDQLGQISSIGFDSGVSVPDSIVESESTPEIRTHRVTYWPTHRQPVLLVANRHSKSPATIGNVRVLSGPDRLSRGSQQAQANKRKHLAFYELPLFADNFSAAKQIDAKIQQPIDDWKTFYTGADRLIQYLKANEYQGAFITVAADGSAIYPSELLSPTSKYDSGIFSSDGNDPKRKDVVELLLKMFEREGLQLVPTFAFSAPLPAVEATRDPDRLANDFELIDYRQQSATSSDGALPRYNPLNLLVQKSVTNVIEEFAKRYSQHSSLSSIAISCRPETYTQLIGQQWCYDEETISRFLSSLPGDPDAKVVRDGLLSSYNERWLDWRAIQMKGWYDEILLAIQRHISNGKLILAPTDLYRNEEISSTLSPSLHLQSDFAKTMLKLGFQDDFTKGRPDLVVLQPTRTAHSQSLASQRVEWHVENSKQSVSFFKQANYPGSVNSNRMSWAHFAEFQQQSPFGSQSSPLMRLQQLSPSGYWNRQHAATSLKDLDSRLLVEGGMILPMGQQDALQPFMKVFSQLPDAPFSSVPSAQLSEVDNPVAVRYYDANDKWYFYAVNGSPWPVTVVVSSTSDVTTIRQLVDKTLTLAENGQFSFQLEPFGLVGGMADKPVDLTDFSIQFPENAEQPLRNHLNKIQLKLAKASKVEPLDVLDNTNFSPGGQSTLNGWNLGQQAATNVKLEKELGRNGSAGLAMVSTGQTVWIRSNQFAAPSTGRLSVSVWLKTDNPDEQPPLRLAIEGRTASSDYYRFGSIGALAPDSETKRVDSKWQRFAVHFDDLPVKRIENLRIGFDLMGPGRVLIDDIEVYDRWFDGNDTKAITQMLATASLLMSKPENLETCRRILNSYWPKFLDQNFSENEPGSKPDTDQPIVQPNPTNVETIQSPRTVKTPQRTRKGLPKRRRR